MSAATGGATAHGIQVGEPRVLWDSNNTVVHLAPAPIIAKVATNASRPQAPDALAFELAIGVHLAGLGVPVAEPSAELPRVLHWRDGLALTFWRYYEADADARVPCEVSAAA